MVLPDSRGIPRVPRYSGTCPASRHVVAYGALTLCGRSFQIVRLTCRLVTRRPCGLAGPTTPPCMHDGLGCSAFARRYWRNHYLFSLPAGTEMVHFPALSSLRLWIQRRILRNDPKGVSPFGNPRVKAHLQLTGAYRSLSRPSSTPGAKAFTVRP